MLRQKCLGAFFGVVLSFVSVYADNLVVNGNFSETSHSKEWGTTLPGKELPRVLNSWALVSADDVNFANSPCATESEGLQDGVWYKIGSQRGYERACYHTLNENSVLGLCVSKRTLQYGVAVFQNIGTPLNTTKKYTLKFKAGFYGEFNVGTGTAISNVTPVNNPVTVGLADVSQVYNNNVDNGVIWTNGIMYCVDTVSLTSTLSDYTCIVDLPAWIAGTYTGTITENQLKMALRFSLQASGTENISQVIIDDVLLKEYEAGDEITQGGDEGGDDEVDYDTLSDFDKFKVNYKTVQPIVPSRDVTKAYLSYSESSFDLSTGVYKNSLADNNYDQHKAYWNDVYNLAVLYAYADFYPVAASTLAAYTGKPEILDLLKKTVNWYFDNNKQCSEHAYHETYSYQDNGFVISIVDRVLGVLGAEVASTTDPDLRKAINAMIAYGDYLLDSGNQTKGVNYALRFDHAFRHVMVSNDSARMDRFRTAISRALTYTLPENQLSESGDFESDGFYPDGMFFHHGDMCYWAMYGFEFIEKMVWVHEFVKNTKWEHTPAEWNTLAFLTYDGARNVIYRGNPEYSAGPKRASEMPLRIEWSVTGLKEIGEHILEYAQDDVAYKPEIINWLANYDITPGVMAEDDEKIELDEHKYFWNGDYQIHRRNGYYIAARRSSLRVRPPEDAGTDIGHLHLHYGSGYTPILLRGDEYRIARIGWNWLALPGTTNEMTGTTASGKAGSTIRCRTAFSGGLQDDKYGCGAFVYDLGKLNSSGTDWDPVNGAVAKKSNFFFDEGMLCTGSDIKRGYTIDGQKADIVTTINQMRSETDVYYSLDNSAEKTLPKATPAAVSQNITDRAWFWHSNTGYVILAQPNHPCKVECTVDMRSLNPILRADDGWQDVFGPGLTDAERSAEKIWMWQLGINHGSDPVTDQYVYIVLPNFTKEQTAAYCNNPKFEVEYLSAAQHVVFHKDEKMYQAVFFNAGSVGLKSGGKITSQEPAIMQLRRKDNTTVVLTVQNPNSYAVASSNVANIFAPEGFVGIKYTAPIQVGFENLHGFSDQTKYINFDNERGYEGRFIAMEYSDQTTGMNPETNKSDKKNYFFVSGNEIIFDGPTADIAVYDLLGRCVYRSSKPVSRVTVDPRWRGCYLMKMAGDVRKIVLN